MLVVVEGVPHVIFTPQYLKESQTQSIMIATFASSVSSCMNLTRLTGATDGQMIPIFGSYMQFRKDWRISGRFKWDHKLTVFSLKFSTCNDRIFSLNPHIII